MLEYTKFCGMERDPAIELFSLFFSPGMEIVGVDIVWMSHVVIHVYIS
jgi:hypothetical protein